MLTGTGARDIVVEVPVERRVRLRMFLGWEEEEEMEGAGREDSNCLRIREPKPAISFTCGWWDG